MARTSFYNDNENRAYPFVKGTAFVPNSAVVSCGFMLGPNTGFEHGVHQVVMTQVRLIENYLMFRFVCDAPGLVGQNILFRRHIDDAPYLSSYADPYDDFLAISASESFSEQAYSVSPSCDIEDDFTGYLTTGDLTNLVSYLQANGDAATGDAIVEHGLLIDLSQAYGRSIRIANGDRTRYEKPTGCKPQCWDVEPQPLYVNPDCFTGAIRFVEGYNVTIRQNDYDNSLTFDGLVGGGDGEPCEQVPVYESEVPPADSVFLEGGPGCGDVLRSINGKGGRILTIKGGEGVTVTSIPAQSRVLIDVNTKGMAVCGPNIDPIPDPDCSETPYGPDECDCGPL